MRASEFLNEENFGVRKSKRPARPGSREEKYGTRGHATQATFNVDEECDIDESGKASKKLCLSNKRNIGASQEASCRSQGYRERDTDAKFTIGGKRQKIKGRHVKGQDYGGPLPKWKGN